MANQRAGILGTGHAYPEGILTNDDLAKIVETPMSGSLLVPASDSDEKSCPGEYTSMFAARAGRRQSSTLVSILPT